MARQCTVCSHDESHSINVELVRNGGNRRIATHYGLSEAAVRRHRAEHIPQLLLQSSQALEVAEADDLLAEVRELQRRAYTVLDAAEQTGEPRTALAAIREARGNLELLAKLLGELQQEGTTNIHLNAEWIELRTAIVAALEPHEEAREAVLRAIRSAGNGGSSAS
jgi:hypothetical protein